MFAFFDKIIGFFETIFTIITNFMTSLGQILQVIFNIPTVVSSLAIMPSLIFTGMTIVISFATIKFILAR